MKLSSRRLPYTAIAALLASTTGGLGAQATVAPPAMVYATCETVRLSGL